MKLVFMLLNVHVNSRLVFLRIDRRITLQLLFNNRRQYPFDKLVQMVLQRDPEWFPTSDQSQWPSQILHNLISRLNYSGGVSIKCKVLKNKFSCCDQSNCDRSVDDGCQDVNDRSFDGLDDNLSDLVRSQIELSGQTLHCLWRNCHIVHELLCLQLLGLIRLSDLIGRSHLVVVDLGDLRTVGACWSLICFCLSLGLLTDW